MMGVCICMAILLFITHDLMQAKVHIYSSDCLCRITETKSLLHKVVFEKAKLQLKHVKRERLLVLFLFLNM